MQHLADNNKQQPSPAVRGWTGTKPNTSCLGAAGSCQPPSPAHQWPNVWAAGVFTYLLPRPQPEFTLGRAKSKERGGETVQGQLEKGGQKVFPKAW